jgi:hypothetical protein
MRALKICVDTSVIGGLEDEEFAEDSQALWKSFWDGHYLAVLSDLTIQELEPAPKNVRAYLEHLPAERVILSETPESLALAHAYVSAGAVGWASFEDAVHVALATTSYCDLLVSWNFKHLVNVEKIRIFNSVNMRHGFGPIDIRSPKELSHDEEEDEKL